MYKKTEWANLTKKAAEVYSNSDFSIHTNGELFRLMMGREIVQDGLTELELNELLEAYGNNE